jgi:hypothetical protein
VSSEVESTSAEAAAVEAPRNVNKLRGAVAVAATARKTTARRVQSLVGNVVLAQMLPDSAVKGGTGLKLRFGDRMTRETPDLDAAFRGDREAFLAELNANLKEGWGDFTGTAVEVAQRAPAELVERITFAYVMQPATVKLSYRGKSFMSVDLEIGYDELEATTKEPDELEMSDEVRVLFAELGLPAPAPVRVLPLHHQISQKLHACSEPGSERAHDLVDLQLMAPVADSTLVRETSERLFAFRAGHAWPPTVVAAEGWEARYTEAANGLQVRQSLDDAVAWANAYIASL